MDTRMKRILIGLAALIVAGAIGSGAAAFSNSQDTQPVDQPTHTPEEMAQMSADVKQAWSYQMCSTEVLEAVSALSSGQSPNNVAVALGPDNPISPIVWDAHNLIWRQSRSQGRTILGSADTIIDLGCKDVAAGRPVVRR